MRAKAKRSSAHRNGSASRGSVADRVPAATPAPSLPSQGIGAPSRRGRLALLSVSALAFASLALASTAFASKEVLNYFGTGAGNQGGELSNPLDVAVNTTGAGPADQGDVYVADSSNNRIQRFDAQGEFVSAWGANAISRDEVQTVTVIAEAGTYTLSFDGFTTAPIAYNAFAFTVDNALDSLPSIGADANVAVSGNPASGYKVTFRGALAGIDQPQMSADDSGLTAPAKRGVTIATVEDGFGGQGTDYEICTEAAKCGQAAASGGNGTTAGNAAFNQPQSVAVDADTGDVYVSDRDNRRVSRYDGEGNFIASFGWDVDETEAGTEYEVCPAANVCKAGTAGSGAGRYGSGTAQGTFGIAVSPPDGGASVGTVFLANSGNRRVETFNLDGSSPAGFGSSSEFGSVQPRKIAVDSRGIVYASNSNSGAGVERYDTLDANGGGVGFLARIEGHIDEMQTVEFPTFISFAEEQFTLTCPDGEQTAPMMFTPLAQQDTIRATLESSCGGSFEVTNPSNGTYVVAYKGSFAGTDIPQMVCAVVPGSGNGKSKDQGRGECGVTAEINGQPGPLPAAGSGTDTATSGLAVDPGSDTLYVLRDPAEGPTVIEQFGPANEPGLAAAPTAIDDTHGAGGGLDSVLGLGIDDPGDRLYVSSNAPGHRVAVLGEGSTLPAPDLTVDEVTVKGETTATFSGSVDPKGALVSCKFEYSTDQASWSGLAATDCDSLDVNGNVQAISQDVTGLDPNTTYYVRLAASRPFVAGSTTMTQGVRVFATDSVPPVVTDVGAIQVQDTSARLVGTIDPRNSATGYVFEYGATPALRSSTAPLDIGAGNQPITVSQVISGLKPDTTYYFLLVATNASGSTPSGQKTLHTRAEPLPPRNPPGGCANDALRQAQGSTFLPDCRAYEMVSPPDKNQGGVDQAFFFQYQAGYSREGDAAEFCTSALFGEPAAEIQLVCAPYLSRRTGDGPTGWTTTSPFPRYCHYDRDDGLVSALQRIWLSPSYDHAYLRQPESSACPIPLIDPAAPDPSKQNLYRLDLATDSFGIDLLAPRRPDVSNGEEFVGASDDFSHIFYRSTNNQTDPPDSPAPGGFAKIYEWIAQGEGACATAGGCLRLASIRPDGSPFISDSDGAAKPSALGARGLAGTVSADGRRLFFSNGSNASTRLYMREDGATTFDLSVPECAVPADCGADLSGEYLAWASPTGDVALFLSCDKLTDESAPSKSCPFDGIFTISGGNGAKLYRWDRNAPEGARLTDLSLDNEPADGIQPNVLDIIGNRAGADGDIVYFATGGAFGSGGQLVSGEPAQTGSGMKLFRSSWNGGSPTLEYLGRYESLNAGVGGILRYPNELGGIEGWNAVRTTPDGEYLTVTTARAVDPVADHDADADVYRWGEHDGWICISCQLPGTPSAGDANTIFTKNGAPADNRAIGQIQPDETRITDDGQRIFFLSLDALLPQDTNGEAGCPVVRMANPGGWVYSCADVYEWHDGTLSLITPGDSNGNAVPIGATADGEEFFFITHQRLLGWDVDLGADIYVAKSGGGFPEPPAVPPACDLNSGACEGPGTVAADIAGAGSARFDGPGNRGGSGENTCGRLSKKAQRKAQVARKAARKGQAKRARALRRQANNLNRRAKRCNRRQGR